MRLRLPALLPLLLAGCHGGGTPAPGDAGPTGDPGNATFQVRESVEQLQITHATPGAMLVLTDGSGAQLQSGVADPQGSLIFRLVPPAAGYVVSAPTAAPAQHSRALTVKSVDGSLPSRDFYEQQKLMPGFGYITTRDGTTLSAFVTLPGPIEMGPYPTLVNYSGYDPSRPGDPIKQYSFLCDQFPSLCTPPSDPSGLIASLFGFATVSVNLRGTGCSGGAYDYFETLELLDGYDVIEAVAAQPWVLGHKVGMTGLSYPGISQLFVASTQPPSLAAITPLSVIGNTVNTLLPGGILNDGFALEWIHQVLDRAAPYGQGWEQKQVDGGDTVCKENQLLHGQKVDNIQEARNTPYYVPARHDKLNPVTFVNKINVPVFLAGSWEDEQTGPFFAELLDKFTGAPVVRFTVHNGVHPDGFAPQVMYEWKSFLDLFVAKRVPTIDKALRDLAPALFDQIFHSMMRLPPDRFTQYKSYDDALKAYLAEPAVRSIHDSGDYPADPGAPQGTFERSFSQWPPKETQVYRLFLGAAGAGATLGPTMPTAPSGGSSFLLDPDAGTRSNLAPMGDVFDKLPNWNWTALSAGHAAVFETAPFAMDTGFLGTGSADLWIKSTANDADLQVSVSEVRPDGQEMYVQSGWLRASYRKTSAASTELWPVQTYLEADHAPLVPGQWTQVRVPIAGFGHVFRKGSKLRCWIDTPGGTRALWRFANLKFPGPVTHTIGHSKAQPSSIALPLIPGLSAPTPLPACPWLRGQPCRAYAAYKNTATP